MPIEQLFKSIVNLLLCLVNYPLSDIHAIMCGAYGYSVKDAKEVYDRFEVTNTLEAYTGFHPDFYVHVR